VARRVSEKHNKHLELDEGYFRVFVVARSYPTDAAASLWKGAVRRELVRKPRLKALFASQVRDVSLQSPGGVYLGEATALLAESARIDRVLEKMTRGLYLHHTGRRLGEVELSNFFISPMTTSRLVDLTPVLTSPTHQIGDVVTYRYGIAADDPTFSVWFPRFYEKAIFVVASQPPGGCRPAAAADVQRSSGAAAWSATNVNSNSFDVLEPSGAAGPMRPSAIRRSTSRRDIPSPCAINLAGWTGTGSRNST
jgi:hypothetical protein